MAGCPGTRCGVCASGVGAAVAVARRMVRRRHTLAPTFLAAASALTLLGCYGSRSTGETVDSGPRTPPPLTDDAGFLPADAAWAVDAGAGEADAGDLPSCRGLVDASTVRVELETIGARSCAFGEYVDVALYSASAVDDGIELLFDACPDADDDCRCRATVHGVGADAVPTPPSGLLSASITPSGIVFEAPCETDCTGPCSCVADLAFVAVDGQLEAPPVTAEMVTASWGEVLCVMTDASECDYALAELELVTWTSGFPGAIGTSQTLEQGQTEVDADSGALTLRVLRSSYPICGGDLPRSAAWVAWQ